MVDMFDLKSNEQFSSPVPKGEYNECRRNKLC